MPVTLGTETDSEFCFQEYLATSTQRVFTGITSQKQENTLDSSRRQNSKTVWFVYMRQPSRTIESISIVFPYLQMATIFNSKHFLPLYLINMLFNGCCPTDSSDETWCPPTIGKLWITLFFCHYVLHGDTSSSCLPPEICQKIWVKNICLTLTYYLV